MQWILLVIGLGALGYLTEDIFSPWMNSSVAIAIGWTAWLSIRLTRLRNQSAQQREQLDAAQKHIESLQQRMTHLEFPPTSPFTHAEPAHDPAPLPDDAVIVATSSAGPELIWDLPDEAQAHSQWPQPAAPLTRAQATEPEPKPEPIGPNLLDQAIEKARDWLLGVNTVLRVGVVLLFLGLAFLLRYATEGMVVPIEARYAGVAASALALLGLGWWLRQRNGPFALMMQGAGIGVLYLTVFGAMKVHDLLDPTLGFGLLVVVTVFCTMLAVTQNALTLACAAALGGFAAPVLSSTGQGSHVALFSYFALLNAGIFAIAWFKAWRLLNLIGFFGTFGIGVAWGMRAYTPELFWTTEPFLVLFFLMYLVIGLLFARHKLRESSSAPDDDSREAMLRWSRRQGDYVDGTLLFGTPIAGFGLQYALTHTMEFGAAFSALALGLLYMGIARLLAGRAPGRALLLVETCLALGVVFTTLAIPLGLDAQWTTCAWAIEGAAVFWLGLRQQRLLARIFGLLLQAAAGLMFLNEMNAWYSPLLAHGDFWTPMIIALAGLISALIVQRINVSGPLNSHYLSPLLIVWGGGWWGLSLTVAALRFMPDDLLITSLLLLAATSAALWTVIALRLRWPALATLTLTLTPVSGVLMLISWVSSDHLFANWAWLGWIAVLAVHLLSLKKLADRLPHTPRSLAHVLGCWLAISVLALELSHAVAQLSEHYNAWRWLGWALLPSMYLLAMTSSRNWPWPIAAYPKQYRVWVAAPLALLMLGWFWLANGLSDGTADPLPYLPLLNPLELGLLFALMGVFIWTRKMLPQLGITERHAQLAAQVSAGASLFVLFSTMVTRSAHHWGGVPWAIDSLLESMQVQAGLSIVWTLMALALMIGGHVRSRREVWIAGAVLIGVVVAKLFFVELSNRGGMARIVSFIGVGVLLLVVGYFAPLPPKTSAPIKDGSLNPEPTTP
ncbi:MAG TPA: DUF2339 domain-containing protein [Pseudomonas sp.]